MINDHFWNALLEEKSPGTNEKSCLGAFFKALCGFNPAITLRALIARFLLT